jgi:3-isopropylmalate/(R)-2-methylmalate dehydratase large subunit
MGVEGTDLTAAMAYGKLWFQVPPTLKVTLDGALMPGVWAKDVTLHMLGKLGAEGTNYQAIEYVGSAVDAMDIDDRMTLCNHAAELGAKAALLEADSKTLQWLAEHNARTPKPVAADKSAQYLAQFSINTAQLTPQLARRHEVDDIVCVTEAAGQKIQAALVGTCTNGRLDDIRQVAAVLKGHRLAPGVRLIVTPASRAIYLKAAQEGLIETIVAAGGSFESAGCGTCISVTGHFTPGDNETIISSANRNFKGRLGNDQADIWLGSAATVAASALRGVITDPREIDHVNWSQL